MKNMGIQKMTSKAAHRIQSHSDKSGNKKGFKQELKVLLNKIFKD